MKKDNQSLYFLIPIIIIIGWMFFTSNNQKEITAEKSNFERWQNGEISAFDDRQEGEVNCLNMSSEEVINFLATKVNMSQKDIEYFNSLPSCLDFCKQQKEYSEKYDDWWAENDVRQSCKELGVVLPK